MPLTLVELGALSGTEIFASPPLLEEQQDSEQTHLKINSKASAWFGSSGGGGSRQMLLLWVMIQSILRALQQDVVLAPLSKP